MRKFIKSMLSVDGSDAISSGKCMFVLGCIVVFFLAVYATCQRQMVAATRGTLPDFSSLAVLLGFLGLLYGSKELQQYGVKKLDCAALAGTNEPIKP